MLEIGIKMKRIRTFFRKLQKSDDARKRRWYFGLSVISISVVLTLWGWYVSAFVALERSEEAIEEKAQGNFLQIMQRGWREVGNNMIENTKIQEGFFGAAIGDVAKKASETHDILIEAPESNFYFADDEERSTATLPIAPKR